MSALSASAFVAPVLARRALRGAKPTRARAARNVRVNAQYDSISDRRARETERVLDRSQEIHSMQEFEAGLSLAGDRLVMVAVESEEECVMSDDVWDRNAVSGSETNKEQCRQLSASLARIAREADNVVFLRVEVLESGETRKIAQELNITNFPTYQYWKVRPRSVTSPVKAPNSIQLTTQI